MMQPSADRCDNTSVGIIINNRDHDIALLTRARFPIGVSPPAGHIDLHGSPRKAAAAEVNEELGLAIPMRELTRTSIRKRYVQNRCRRPGGDHHWWWIFETHVPVVVDLKPDPNEACGANWYSRSSLQRLADRTREFQAGGISAVSWHSSPGIEEVWIEFLAELKYIT
jgi:8-oxo-dGTP pyrophosphatase MutT (NUDIX family)